MATASQLQQLIRFGLDTLGEGNTRHNFETLSQKSDVRELANASYDEIR